MREEFLHYLWRHKLLQHSKLVTVQNESITIFNYGFYNKNSGPDFLNASIQIGNQLWYGNVEMHVKASDWYAHQHEIDSNYDAVILHVVFENDIEVYVKNNKPVPTLELKDKIDDKLKQNYTLLLFKNLNWIPCEKHITNIDAFTLNNWLERLFFERLERKSGIILEMLKESNNDYEAVLFQLLASNFGLKVNGHAFLRMSQSFDFSILRKVQHSELILSALIFGQAGFLEENIEDIYYTELKKEFEYLKYKYKLTPVDNRYFQFFRMRPNNFPTIRLAQLCALYHKHQNLFIKLMQSENADEVYRLFHVKLNSFWKFHYTFQKKSKERPKKLTKPFIDLLIINTIIPLKFVYFKNKGMSCEDNIIDIITSLKPEKNSIIMNFEKLQVKAENSLKTQALLELKNSYCDSKRCLNCVIGNSLIKNS